MSHRATRTDTVAITCVYCGASHATPAELRACWQRSNGIEHTPPQPAVDPTPPARRIGPGPDALGRHVIVTPGAPAPPPWQASRRIDVAAVAPAAAVAALRAASAARERLVLELADGAEAAWRPGIERREPFELGPRFAFVVDELAELVFANAVDHRAGEATWALADAAASLGARPPAAGEPGDVVLADGTPLWLDGGPVRVVAPIDGVAVVHAVAAEHGRLAPPRPDAATSTTAALAADQRAAVLHESGAARIIAPAGSGKTRVLTERARHLIGAWRMPPSAVSLVAFNKRAQEEMRERTLDVEGLHVRTLNSIGLSIVNGTPPFALQPRQWRTIDEPEVRAILDDLVTFPKRRNTDPVAPWIEALSLVRLGLRAPHHVEPLYGGEVAGLTHVWPGYRAALEGRGALDFDDQIYRAIEVLLTQPTARRAAQRACRLLLVDEFQDLTPAHLLLVRLLTAPGGAVFGVGDDDQTIYGYNGADPGWLVDFGELFPGAGDHPLEINYRCPPAIVTAADNLLRYNRRRIPKTIRAAPGRSDGGGVRAVAAAGGDTVAATTAAVRAALDGGGAPGDVAVLTRVNAMLAPAQVALATGGIPISGGVGGEFLERTTVRAVLAWLRLAGGSGEPWRAADLAEALRRPSRSLHPRLAGWVTEQRDVAGLRRLAGRVTSERDAERIAAFADDVDRLRTRAAGGAPLAALVADIVDGLGLATAVTSLDASRRGMNRASQGDDLTALRQLAALAPPGAPFEQWVRDGLFHRRAESGVVLATVHRVKGQEWDHVVVHHAEADQYPHRLADDVEEERRLFHVALTRARRWATVVTGGAPSPFVAELTEPPPTIAPSRPGAPIGAAAPVTAGRRSGASADPLTDRSVVVAGIGMVLVDQGAEWTVVDLDADAVTARAATATRRFRAGAAVVTAGRQRGTLQLPGPPLAADTGAILDALRVLRERLRGGKPAYVVFDDKTLAAIAVARPANRRELAAITGVGPAKLDRYGDAVLELVASFAGPGPMTPPG